MKLDRFYGGWKPSPPDARGSHDLHDLPRIPSRLRLTVAALPESADNSSLVPEVLDQNGFGACVGYGTAAAIWGELVRAWTYGGSQGPQPECPSPLWGYWLGRVLDGSQDKDAGTYVSSTLQMLTKTGFVGRSAWPSESTILLEQTDVYALERLAYDQRLVTGTARITSVGAQLIADVKTALAAGYLVTGGTLVDSSFAHLGPGDIWQGCRGVPLGGHCVCLISYDRDTFTLRNSWGTSWGTGGSCRAIWDAIHVFEDLWVISSAPDYSGTK